MNNMFVCFFESLTRKTHRLFSAATTLTRDAQTSDNAESLKLTCKGAQCTVLGTPALLFSRLSSLGSSKFARSLLRAFRRFPFSFGVSLASVSAFFFTLALLRNVSDHPAVLTLRTPVHIFLVLFWPRCHQHGPPPSHAHHLRLEVLAVLASSGLIVSDILHVSGSVASFPSSDIMHGLPLLLPLHDRQSRGYARSRCTLKIIPKVLLL